VADNELVFQRKYDLPAAIVWDAFVDEDLLEGWLGRATVDARVGGRYNVEWAGGTTLGRTEGVIVELDPRRRIVIQTDNAGRIEFTLGVVAGGTRGTATALSLQVTVATERRLLGSTVAHWRGSLDQLEDLLRGHPVDWNSWQEDRGQAWASYLRGASLGH
jgi:uncharacterized protein YndB with AHSA1/START domain